MGAPVVHFEIHGSDLSGLTDFYANVFGWEMHDAMPGYRLVHTNAGKGIEGGIGAGEDSPTPGLVFYVEVDDPQAALDTIEASGGKVITPVTEIPNAVTFAHFADPEGHVVGIVKSEPAG